MRNEIFQIKGKADFEALGILVGTPVTAQVGPSKRQGFVTGFGHKYGSPIIFIEDPDGPDAWVRPGQLTWWAGLGTVEVKRCLR